MAPTLTLIESGRMSGPGLRKHRTLTEKGMTERRIVPPAAAPADP